jgi:hypothetical protein
MQLSQVNTTDIRDAVALGCQTMSRVFNADDNDIPFFIAKAWPQAELAFNLCHSEAHVPGRHLNALLNAQAALSIEVDEAAIEKHARAACFSYSGPVALPLNRQQINGPLVNFAPHNIREGFHALNALVQYRDDEKARRLAEASIQAIFDLWNPDNGWNREVLQNKYGLQILDYDAPFLGGVARSIGPLAKYYAATGYAPALQLATLLKDKVLCEYLLPDGEYHEALGHHTHSVTCVMSSLAQLAMMTRDAPLMERVRKFYCNGLETISNEIGWSLENASGKFHLHRGEANNTGDILETVLLLAQWGYTDCFHRAERILRCHLLPSQLRDVSFLANPDNPQNRDGLRDVVQRLRGAYGFPAPYGHLPVGFTEISFHLDVVGGVVASLCEAWRVMSHTNERGHFINLLFSRQNEDFDVVSSYEYSQLLLRIDVKKPAPLWVRMPPWAEREKVKIRGASALPGVFNGYLCIPQPKMVCIAFPLARREMELAHRNGKIRALLYGDEIAAMENFGANWTFFPDL